MARTAQLSTGRILTFIFLSKAIRSLSTLLISTPSAATLIVAESHSSLQGALTWKFCATSLRSIRRVSPGANVTFSPRTVRPCVIWEDEQSEMYIFLRAPPIFHLPASTLCRCVRVYLSCLVYIQRKKKNQKKNRTSRLIRTVLFDMQA
mmetsp:Transcript_15354/g.38805  ORF Transcript_15354/g.38805 Transcript_15354/m.38805 type:complete len:149 (+) Transcript_15354:192-638(+)